MTEEVLPAVAKEVIETTIDNEIERGYAEYATYTIEERALPDIRDGLKPVQRRILFDMHELGLNSDKATSKSARVVGDCMGKYHPHGDQSIYDAMVRLAQPFTFPLPPVYGQGNFGLPGESAASYRYTEARLSYFGELMTEELKDSVVPMRPNFDNELEEPLALPTKIPTLLINGQTGIAVAMATNMAPHNPIEAIRAVIYQLRHQDQWLATKDPDKHDEALEQLVNHLMEVLPGPDFPTGAKILGLDGIKEAYMTGLGRIVMQAKYRIEPMPRGQHRIEFYEIPYDASPSGILSYLKDNEEKYIKSRRILRENGGKGKEEGFQIEGVISIDDYSDRQNPTRITVVVDAKTNPEAVVAELFKKTKLESSFNFNQNCLINGTPKTVNLPEIIQHFINFRRSITKNRSINEKIRRQDRIHILEGLAKVLVDIDKAISIIRDSESQDIARDSLKEIFSLDDAQAKYVLDTPLRRLTKYDNLELSQEQQSLKQRVQELELIIENPDKQNEVIENELQSILDILEKEDGKAKLGKISMKRKSEIVGATLAEYKAEQKEALNQDRTVSDKPCTRYLDHNGRIQHSSEKGYIAKANTSTLGSFYLVTNKGRGIRVNTVDMIPNSIPKGLEPEEKVVTILSGKTNAVIGTRNGIVYSFQPNFPARSDEFSIIELGEGDEVIGGSDLNEPSELVFISTDSSLLHYSDDKVAAKQTINGKGMAGIKLDSEQHVLSFNVIPNSKLEDAGVTTWTGTSVKYTPLSEYPSKGRATSGVRSHKFLRGEEKLTLSSVGTEMMFHTSDGKKLNPTRFLGKRDSSGAKINIELASLDSFDASDSLPKD